MNYKYLQPIFIIILFIGLILLANALNNLSAKLAQTNALAEQVNGYLLSGVQAGIFPSGEQITQRLQQK